MAALGKKVKWLNISGVATAKAFIKNIMYFPGNSISMKVAVSEKGYHGPAWLKLDEKSTKLVEEALAEVKKEASKPAGKKPSGKKDAAKEGDQALEL